MREKGNTAVLTSLVLGIAIGAVVVFVVFNRMRPVSKLIVTPPANTNTSLPSGDTSRLDLKQSDDKSVDLTLEPDGEWRQYPSFCGVTFKLPVSSKTVEFGSDEGEECVITTEFESINGYRAMLTLKIYKDYDGRSRREFFIKKHEIELSKDYTGYLGAKSFKAGKNNGIALMFEPSVMGVKGDRMKIDYLIALDGATLIAVNKGLESNEINKVVSEEEFVKMFLTSISL